jgi:MFS family permease
VTESAPVSAPDSAPNSASDSAPLNADVNGARQAVGWVFAACGLGLASWLARMPAVRDDLQLRPGQLAWLMVSLSVGSLSMLPVSGILVHRWGPTRTVRNGACVLTAGVLLGAFGAAVVGKGTLGVALTALGLFVAGTGMSVWDVAMNVEGADVERLVERSIMPRFHAAFSLGTMVAAGLGAAAAAFEVPVFTHMVVVIALVLVTVLLALRRFIPVLDHEQAEKAAQGSGARGAWSESRTLLIGLMVLGLTVAEGSANDWLALGMVDGYRVEHAVGALALGLFVTSMTVVRLVGPGLLDRHGRVPVLRASAGFAVVGIALVVGGGHLRSALGLPGVLTMAAVGALVWGAGSALGFPVGMSAAADDPKRAPARVSVVATIGYGAFLAGPPLLGILGDHWGVLDALTAIAVPVLASLAVAGAARVLVTDDAQDVTVSR